MAILSQSRPLLLPSSSHTNIYPYVAKRVRIGTWKGISKRAMRQELVKKSELAQIAEGRRDGEVGEITGFYPPNSQQGQTEWSHFFVCLCVQA